MKDGQNVLFMQEHMLISFLVVSSRDAVVCSSVVRLAGLESKGLTNGHQACFTVNQLWGLFPKDMRSPVS